MSLDVYLLQIGPEIEAILMGVASAVVYSFIFYAKKYASKSKESFNERKLAATIIVGAIIGAAYGYYGIPVTQATLFEKLATYAGTIALVESILKMIFRVIRKKFGG